MTDRIGGFIVVLEQDIREDDAEATLTALRQVRGVVSVEPVVTDTDTHLAHARIKLDLRMKVWNALEAL